MDNKKFTANRLIGRIIGACVIFLLYLITFQDLVASFVFKLGLPIDFVKAFLFLKETVVVLGGLLILAKTKISTGRLLMSIFILYSSLFLFISDLPFYFVLLSYRTYVLLFFSFIVGEHLGGLSYFERTFYKHLKILFWFVLTFSVLEYFVFPENIWNSVFPVIQMKRDVLNLSIDEYYHTGRQVNAIGELTRRMIGPFNDPLTLAYFTVLLVNFFVAGVVAAKGVSRWQSFLGIILIVMTQTRAIVLGLAISISMLLIRVRRVKLKHIVIGMSIITFALLSVIIFWSWFSAFTNSIFTKEGRNIGHLKAYVDGIRNLLQNPWGHGIGTSSVMVSFSSKQNSTENAFINLGIEIGIIGILLLTGIFGYFLKKFNTYLTSNAKSTGNAVVVAGYLLLVQYTFAGFVAPHIFIARILIPFMIIIGWAYAVAKRNVKE